MVRRSKQTPDSHDKVRVKLFIVEAGKTALAQLYKDEDARKHWLPFSEIIETPCDDDSNINARIVEIPLWLAKKNNLTDYVIEE